MATIFVYDRQSDMNIDFGDLPDAIHTLLRLYKKKAHELSFHFVSSDQIKQLHAQYFGNLSVTDCIGFPIDSPSGLMGDIFICPKTAICYAHKHGLDAYDELLRYTIHALLHFFGFGDQNATQQALMSHQENRSLEKMRAREYAFFPY